MKWSIEEVENKLALGDCLDILLFIPSNSIDLIIIDPPFGVEIQNNEYFDDSKIYVFNNIVKWIPEIYRVLKNNGHCYIYVPSLEIDRWVHEVKKYFELNNLLGARNYTTHQYVSNKYDFSLQIIIYCSKGKAKDLNYTDWIRTSDSWYSDKRNKNPVRYTRQYPSYIPQEFRANVKPNAQIKLLHPCQKKEELIERLILNSSNIGDLVADFFMGSGSTLAAAKKLHRKYFGSEIKPDNYKIAERRLATVQPYSRSKLSSFSIIKEKTLMKFMEGI